MDKKFNKNVFGETIETCSNETMTGYLRNGSCETLDDDVGSHTAVSYTHQTLPTSDLV